jgi:tetratricopeptide (TPR) repeat protein/4-amino-4-deoxy-L-arabinose transferase-like glycosyltransferase
MTSNLAGFAREHRWIVILCLVFATMGALRLNDLSLYTDCTRYVIWGTSFAHAKGFVDETQPDPERYVVNAPLYSVLIAPALLFFPSSLMAAKVWTLLWGIGFIMAFYAMLRHFFGKGAALIGLLPVIFHPLLLLLSTEVLSEAAFLTFVCVGFLSLERLENEGNTTKRDLLMLLLVTSFIVLLREVAIALVVSVLLYFLVRKQYKRSLLVLAGFGVFFGAWLYRNLVLVGAPPSSQATNLNYIFEHFLTPAQAPLLQEFGLRIVTNMSGYAVHLGGMIFYPLPDVLIVEPTGIFLAYYRLMAIAKFVIPIAFVPMFVLGIWRDISERPTGFVRILFVVGYLLTILIYPVHDVRFLLPVFPLMIFYVIAGFKWIQNRWLQGHENIVQRMCVAICIVIIVPNAICIFEIERTNIRYSADPIGFYGYLQQAGLNKNMFTKPWKALGESIKNHTPEGSTIAGSAKEISIFIGDRKLLELNNAVPVTTFDSYLRGYAADYLMATNSWDDFQSYEFQMSESHRFWFEPIVQIAGMQLFKVHPTYVTPKEIWLTTKRISIDTVTANGLLRKGRLELLRGQYDDAITSLLKAKQYAPGQAMIPYQLSIAYAMSGKLTEASAEVQNLFTYAQSTSYTPLATRHLAVAVSTNQVEQAENAVQRSLSMTDIAAFYWNLGYCGAAYSLLKGQLAIDSTYFSGLLWGWDYAMQRGDTAQAKVYLRNLIRIDRANPVVQQFISMDRTADSLRRISDPVHLGKFHLAIAQSFKSIELFDEAIDEAQRSLRNNPRNVDAWIFQATLFEEKKLRFAARWAYRQALLIDPEQPIAKSKAKSLIVP